MSFVRTPKLGLFVLSALPLLLACSSDESSGGGGGAGGSSATGNVAGSASGSGGVQGGTGGASAGTGGAMAGSGGATAGAAGAGGSGGAAGSNAGGAAGSNAGGAAGANTGGVAGSAGSGGMSGAAGGGKGGTSGAAGTGGASGSGGAGGGGPFTLTSPAFDNMTGCSKTMASACDVFPSVNTSYMSAMNISPELRWTGVPTGTQSFVVLLRDVSNENVHWVLWNIVPSTSTMLAADVAKNTATPAAPANSRQANATFAPGDGYFGPGSACNVYEFVLYALSVPMFTPSPANEAGSVRTQLLALGSQILGTASLVGRANYMMQCPP